MLRLGGLGGAGQALRGAGSGGVLMISLLGHGTDSGFVFRSVQFWLGPLNAPASAGLSSIWCREARGLHQHGPDMWAHGSQPSWAPLPSWVPKCNMTWRHLPQLSRQAAYSSGYLCILVPRAPQSLPGQRLLCLPHCLLWEVHWGGPAPSPELAVPSAR